MCIVVARAALECAGYEPKCLQYTYEVNNKMLEPHVGGQDLSEKVLN
jgi:hypothetical protein